MAAAAEALARRRLEIRRQMALLEAEDRALRLDLHAARLAASPPSTDDDAASTSLQSGPAAATPALPPVLPEPSIRFWGKDKVALASYPRSGNSLLRRLVEQLTGTVTGSDSRIDRPLVQQLIEMGFAGEGVVDDRVWLIKTHFPERAGYKKCTVTRAIVLVRNPFDALVSNFHMLLTSSHTKSAVEEEFFSNFADLWNDWILEEAGIWAQFHEHWKACNVPKLVVRYEDLIQHRTEEVARIASFLFGPLVRAGYVNPTEVIRGIERVASVEETKLALYIPRKGLVPQSIDTDLCTSLLDLYSPSIPEIRAEHLTLDPRKPGYVSKALHLYSKSQFETVLACTRSFLCTFGYWQPCIAASPKPPPPDMIGYVDRPVGQCILVRASAAAAKTGDDEVVATLNAQYGLRPRTRNDPHARGFDIRWEARMRELPEARTELGV